VAESAPRDLFVDRIEIDGEEFAVFSWDAEVIDDAGNAAGSDAVADPPAALTPSERSVLALVVAGASNAAIARSRASSVRTVANQVASLLDKLGADSRFDLIRRYGRSGPTSESP
jgi:DNA-binding NarL/FixJ family response regulator